MFLQGNTNSGILINDIVLIILLFADDMAIFGNNPEDIQNNLNVLHDYCNTWGLEVNGHLGHTNWVSNVKKIVDDYGFPNVFTTVKSDVLQTFPLLFKQRVIGCFVQEWQGYVDRSAVLEEYKLYKNVFSFEAYLLWVPKDLRMYLTRFRISSHYLRI